ncbi:MAG: HAD hydrolase-like protein [Fuerstiella sp.]
MPQNSPKIILFDIDGTILRCKGAGQMAMEAALTEVFSLRPPFQNIPCAGRTDRGIGSSVFETFQQQDSEQNRIRFRNSYLSHLPRCLSDCDAILLPGIVELLDALDRDPNIDVSLLTGNYEAAANIKLQHFGLLQRFQGGVFGDTHAERDRLATDAVEQFSAAHGTQLSGHHFLIIGDTPADIQCARAINAPVLAVATGIHNKAALETAEPDVLLNDLSDTNHTMKAIVNLLQTASRDPLAT